MYSVAIARGFVMLLMAAAESMTTSVPQGLLTLVFYGIFPLALVLWLLGTPQRRRNRARIKTMRDAETVEPGSIANSSSKPD